MTQILRGQHSQSLHDKTITATTLSIPGLTPGVSKNTIIDYTTNSSMKKWTKATQKLEDEL